MLAARDEQLAAQAAQLAARDAALASTRAEREAERAAAAAQYRHAMHLYGLEKRRVKLDDCLQYVARRGPHARRGHGARRLQGLLAQQRRDALGRRQGAPRA